MMMKQFLNISAPYKFEWQDLRALGTVINVFLIIAIGLEGAWFGLVISIIGIIKDCTNENRHLNDFILHGATTILNIHLLTLI